MHNPFQSYQADPTLAAYAGMTTPFSVPYPGVQTSLANPALTNPAALHALASALGASCATTGLSQLGQTGYAGIPSYGNIHPQQLQLASLLTQQGGIPQVFGQNPMLQNPYTVQNPWITGGLQNPLATAGLQNPLVTAGLQQHPLLNPILAQQQFGQPFGLQQPLPAYSPYQQIGQISPFAQQGLPFAQQQGLPFGQPGLPYGQPGLPYGPQISPFAQIGSPFAQHGLPYGQFGSPLAPQSWVGQGGPFGGGQIHPLLAQQLVARAFHTPGIPSWTGF
jgi:hypothetical protein